MCAHDERNASGAIHGDGVIVEMEQEDEPWMTNLIQKGLKLSRVVLIGEHGEYPADELGRHMYPRKHLFEQIAGVFAQSGRSVPVRILTAPQSIDRQTETARKRPEPVVSSSGVQ